MSFKQFICKVEGKKPQVGRRATRYDGTDYRLLTVDVDEMAQLWLQYQDNLAVRYETMNDAFSWSSLSYTFAELAITLDEDDEWITHPVILDGVRNLFCAIWEGHCFRAMTDCRVTVFDLSDAEPGGAFAMPLGASGLAHRSERMDDDLTEDEMLDLMADDEEGDSPFRAAPW